MARIKFTLRDWLWLALVVAIVLAWAVNYQHTSAQLIQNEQQRRQLNIDFQKQKVAADRYMRYWMQTMRANTGTGSINVPRTDAQPQSRAEFAGDFMH